jgi:CRISPR-associated protein (TIGR02584 family)
MAEAQKILLCVTGLSPQIVTETLYALAIQQQWLPDRVLLITTEEGARRARLALLSEAPGWFHRLLADYRLPPIRFSDADILVLKDAQNQPLADIRTPEDNQRAADFIVETLRQLTADASNQLHVSIAGGRKTMGFYLGYALTLFGRNQDQLSHVLVSEPFESSRDFFYPTPYSKVMETRDKAWGDARDAEITLANIPFVSLRHGMTDAILQGDISFAGAVEAITQALAPPGLVIDLEGRLMEVGGCQVRLEPTALALLSVFARRCLNGQPPLPAPNKEAPDTDWAERFLYEYEQIKGDWPDSQATRTSLRQGMDGSYFSSCKSKLHSRLKKCLGPAARHYLIDDGGCRPGRYALRLEAGAIQYRKLAVADGSGF